MEANQLKLLAVDDNQDNLTTLKAVVRDALPGCMVLTAASGPRGLELARTEDPDAILLDIVMPGMDGFEVCRRLKADEALRSIPVIFPTALRTDRESRVQALQAGAEAFLSKPLDEQELVAQVRAMAKVKAANRLQRLEKEQLAALVAEHTQQLVKELAERRQKDAALCQSNEWLALAQRSAGAGMWDWDITTGRFDWSPELFRLFGLDPDHTAAGLEAWTQAVHPEDRKLAADRIEQAVKDRTPLVSEYRVVLSDGSVRWINSLGNGVYGPDGRPRRMSGICLDITERKRAEAGIQDAQALNNTIIDSIPGTFYLLDEHGRYTRWNSYQRDEILGQPEEQMAGMNALDTIHPEDRALIQARIANVLQDGKVELVESRVLLRGGPAFIWMLMTGRRMTIAGRPSLVGTGIDITERKQAEAALRQKAEALRASNAELEQFNRAMVGRELRMIELKQEINELCHRLGEPPRHATDQFQTDRVPGAGPATAPPGGGGA
ncbi:MAG: PAS domain S-box protein [Verrucomicrobiota bacterium]